MTNNFEKGQKVRDKFSKAVGTVVKTEKENLIVRFQSKNEDEARVGMYGEFTGKGDKITVDFGGKHSKPEIYHGPAGLEALKP